MQPHIISLCYSANDLSKQSRSGVLMDVSELLAFTVKNNASDLHISSGEPPMIRINGDMTRIKMDPLDRRELDVVDARRGP